MKLKSSNLLGIAVSDREFTLAQAGTGKSARLQTWARWPVPEDASMKRPDALGKRLREFMDEKDFSAREAVVGVPARWLIAEPCEVPAGNREQALAVLRLRAERLGVGDEHGVVFDVAGLDSSKQTSALLVGIDAARLEQLQKVFAAAGLEVRAVTATGLALAETFRRETGQTLVLFGGHGTELVRRDAAGKPTAIRHLNGVPASGDVAGKLSGELARALSLGGGETGGEGGGSAGPVALVGGPNFSDSDVAAIADRLGRDVHSATPLEALGELSAVASLNGEAAGVVNDRVWPAVALAGLGGSRGGLPVDFLDPKLAPPPEPRFDRKIVYGTAAAVLLVGGLTWLYFAARQSEQQAVALEARVDEAAPAVEQAEEFIARVQFGRGFYEQGKRPPALDMMADLARSYPQSGGIWVSGFTMRADGKSSMQGRAGDQRLVLGLRDKLMAAGDFDNVALLSLNQGGGRGSSGAETSYSLGFNYKPLPAGVEQPNEQLKEQPNEQPNDQQREEAQ